MSPRMLDSWGKLILDHLGVQGISSSLLSLGRALKPKLEIVAAPSVKPCGPTPSQIPQTCLAIVFFSDGTTSWQAGNERGIGGEAQLLMIVSLKREEFAPSLWFKDSISEALLGKVIAYTI
jgi:hypothetical protein